MSHHVTSPNQRWRRCCCAITSEHTLAHTAAPRIVRITVAHCVFGYGTPGARLRNDRRMALHFP
jgi:hypothetical protein